MRKYVFAFIIIMLIVSVCLNIGMYRHIQTEVVKSDTVYKEITVEVRDSAPVAKEDKTIGQVTFPVLSSSSNTGKNHVKETGKSIHDTANIARKDENLNMTLDVVQRKYTDDSTYTAYVSGLKYGIYPRLDSIITKHRIIERTVTNTIRGKQSRWHVGVTAGYGYGFRSRTLEPFIGIGLQYSIW